MTMWICSECGEETDNLMSAPDGPDFCPNCRSVDTMEDAEDVKTDEEFNRMVMRHGEAPRKREMWPNPPMGWLDRLYGN